jgi:DNA modification methylase
MKKATEHELSFEPKSLWKYEINTSLDKIITDEVYSKSLQSDDNKIDWVKAGSGGFMSKFVTENAKKVIEFWSKEGDNILDPFAGRTRGLISTILGRNYTGYDVLDDNISYIYNNYNRLQTMYNMAQLELVNKSSEFIDEQNRSFDMIYTCPPYWNVEKYPSVPGQLSDIKKYDDFLKVYENIILKTSKLVKPGGFFVIVIANFRRGGEFIDFRSDTSSILKSSSLKFHDEVILEMSPAKRHPLYPQAITNLNTLKVHEYCLVFRRPCDNIVDVNDSINLSRPTVSSVYNGIHNRLFWSKDKGKKDWINSMFDVNNK